MSAPAAAAARADAVELNAALSTAPRHRGACSGTGGRGWPATATADLRPNLNDDTANLRTKILDFTESDSSRILSLRSGTLMPIGNSPEVSSQQILAGIINLRREIGRMPNLNADRRAALLADAQLNVETRARGPVFQTLLLRSV